MKITKIVKKGEVTYLPGHVVVTKDMFPCANPNVYPVNTRRGIGVPAGEIIACNGAAFECCEECYVCYLEADMVPIPEELKAKNYKNVGEE